MSNNEQFPGLGEQNQQKEQVPESWDNEIPKQEKKQKKKLKLPAQDFSNNNQFGAVQQDFGQFGQQQDFSQFGQQQDFGQFGQQQDFGQFGQQQDFGQFGQQPQMNDVFAQFAEPAFQQPEEEPYFSYLANNQYKKFGGDYPSNTIQDQFGNLFEIELNQYVEDGIIYDQQDQDESNDYWNNVNKNKTTQKKDTKKKAKKETKTPQPQLPKKIPKRLQKPEDQQAAPIKKQEKFTMDQLREKEIKAHKGQEDKYLELDTVKQPLNIVFIGHVDAGKSTLSGRILIDTDEIDAKTLKSFEEEAAKNGREGWYMAYAMDLSEDERAKGKTVETGKAFFQLSQRRFTLLDAPGHKNYVPNMIAGACQSDIACLIISSKQGEFEAGYEKGGQTQEHVQLIRALGVQHLVCVISKMDTNNWSEERYNNITNEMGPWLKKTCGFDSVQFIPINAFDSENVSKRVSSAVCSWYNGPSLFDHLNTVPVPERKHEGSLKIPVLDIQKDEGKYYCYGKIEQGNIFEDMHVTAMPYNKTFQIKEIYDAKDRRLYYAAAGENVKFMVKGIDSEEDLQRGFVICATDDLCGVAYEFLAEIQLLEMPEQKQIMSNGYKAVLHMHTAVQEVDVSEIQAAYDKSLGKMVKAPLLRSGEKGIVKITSEKYICLEKFETQPFLSRFTLRDENTTIAYGTVKKYKPAKGLKK